MAPDAAAGLEYLHLPSADTALSVLSPSLRLWFAGSFGTPTPAQRLAWPALTGGRHLLVSAPTGSGKTLAAIVPILDRLWQEPLDCGISCLHVAPLKSLAADVAANLGRNLEALQPFFPASSLSVGLRTGDTSAEVRRQLRLDPPTILVTTPESLALMLTQPAHVENFRPLRWIIVDEVHALAGNKRGADLALSLERLRMDDQRPPIQRIGLSATCRPLSEAARFLAGAGRPCAVAEVIEPADLELTIEPLPDDGAFLARLVERLRPELARNRTTLIFANVRNLAERMTWALRRRFPCWAEAIAVHHSSLDVARRREVEQQLKAGRLRAVVSSTSLEMGIDIGSVDGVVLVHPPGGVVRLRQRLGRAGHAPGRPQRGLVLTATAAELLEAAVTGASSRSALYEPFHVPDAPLDVLCQQLLGLAAQQPWTSDEAFALVRSAYPYRQLARSDFDDCVAYLLGSPRDDRPWLPPRLRREGDRFAVADRRTEKVLRRNLGTIIADELRPVVTLDHQDDDFPTSVPIGAIDDSFADRLRPGDRFLLDARCLEYRRTDGPALVVEEVPGRPLSPRWAGGKWHIAPDLARRLFLLRGRAAEALRDGPGCLAALLQEEYGLGPAAAGVLVAYFLRQECVSEISACGTCLVEVVAGQWGAAYYLHTPLNRAGNDALARVLTRRLAVEQGLAAMSLVADLGLQIALRRPVDLAPASLRGLLRADAFDDDLAAALADCDSLREHFRRVALTGLMLLRNPLGRRRKVGGPDWAQRRLFDKVRLHDPNFVLLRQAGREVRQLVVDAAAAAAFLAELPRWRLHLRRLAAPSPFVESWTQLEAGPRSDVESPDDVLHRLHARLWGEEAHDRA